ncbi:MAG: tRNA threonylcarbamoyladenosine dehydratase [Burkholderiaceae bacterium]
MRRLYGAAPAQRCFDAHVVVVGIGGVGSWAVEALARSGVGQLTLVDLDHIAESNINRQVHALDTTLGQAKVEAMRERALLINPACKVRTIDEFVTVGNHASILGDAVDQGSACVAVLDACDQVPAKVALAAWSLERGLKHVAVGAAGGKRIAHSVEVDDLSAVTHDPLLAKVRYQLRKSHGAPRAGRMRLTTVFSREPVVQAVSTCETASGQSDGGLNCHGYGSSVAVTATFGMVAAGEILNAFARR